MNTAAERGGSRGAASELLQALDLPQISPISPLFLPMSPLYLPYISTISPLYLQSQLELMEAHGFDRRFGEPAPSPSPSPSL